MFKKIIWLLGIVVVLSFTSCGDSNSRDEVKEGMTKILNFVGIPTDTIVAVCIDKDKNAICTSTEVQVKITLDNRNNVDDILEELALNEDEKYLLEVYDEKLPILITIQDEATVDYNDGKFTLAFDGFNTKDNNETKEISIFQSMVDTNVLKINIADKFRTLMNAEAQEKLYKILLSSLESNINTFRTEGLDSKIDVIVKEMADKIETNQEQANRINSCDNNQTCVDKEIKILSDELILIEEEIEDIANLKFTKNYILGKKLYMVRAETNSYFTVIYDTIYGKREIRINGNTKQQEYFLNENGEIIVDNGYIIIKLIAHYDKYDHIQVSLPKSNKVYNTQRAYFNEKDAKEYFLSINNNNKTI